jgi:trehalose/maltose hydrolase-like predicted phosphorylase
MALFGPATAAYGRFVIGDGEVSARSPSGRPRPGSATAGPDDPAASLPGALAESTFDAVIVGWDGLAAPDRRAHAPGMRDRVEALSAAGVHVVIVSDLDIIETDRELGARPEGPGRLHLCVDHGSAVFTVDATGPTRTLRGTPDTPEAIWWAAGWLAERGITGGLILVVETAIDGRRPLGASRASLLARATTASIGDGARGLPPAVIHVGGGAARLLQILDVQLALRRDGRVPSIDLDPSWVVELPDEPAMERVAEALGALTNGWAGSRGTREEAGPSAAPLFAANGTYTVGPVPELLPGPRWDGLTIAPADAGDDGPAPQDHRVVDLRTGVLARWDRCGLRTVRLLSMARPTALALRAEGPPERLGETTGLDSPAGPGRDVTFERWRHRGADLARVGDPGAGGITIAARDRAQVTGGRRTVERLAAWTTGQHRASGGDDLIDQLEKLEGIGFDALLAEHRHAWSQRWADAEVHIEGAPGDELAARFAVFHLLGAAPDQGEAAVGARGVTGPAYGGHVFWDAEAFVLPALAAIRPAAARAMLEYRLRRLAPARAAAAQRGFRGARFPWESATDGTEVTPPQSRGHHGELLPVLTDDYEEHIVADIAWAACRYADWTGDAGFLDREGRPLLIETARYWASRIRCDDGHGHLEGVMGPDEYHAVVDDDVFTNVMARWNLRRAAELVERTVGPTAETRTWRGLVDGLVDGYDVERGMYEQCAGYWQLETLLAAEIAPPPVAADLLLGAERVAASQIIKQADVIMAHHLVPDEMVPGSLAADLAYYEPRTAHGSSLSPAIYAAQLARAGQPDEALALFRLAARLDLDDITGTTAGGLHLATFGGVWQALAHGFLGLHPDGATLRIDPCLPSAWDALALRLRFLGHPVGVRSDGDRVAIDCAEPLAVQVATGPPRRCTPPGGSFAIDRSPR